MTFSSNYSKFTRSVTNKGWREIEQGLIVSAAQELLSRYYTHGYGVRTFWRVTHEPSCNPQVNGKHIDTIISAIV